VGKTEEGECTTGKDVEDAGVKKVITRQNERVSPQP
jgi:hypothetical protein